MEIIRSNRQGIIVDRLLEVDESQATAEIGYMNAAGQESLTRFDQKKNPRRKFKPRPGNKKREGKIIVNHEVPEFYNHPCYRPPMAGCHQDVLYVENQRFQRGMEPGPFLKFDVPVTDTQNFYTIYLQVRNDGRYEYSNLWLFITTSSPTGAVMQDTVECVLAAPDGRWLGRGSGGRFSLEIPYRYQVRFSLRGSLFV